MKLLNALMVLSLVVVGAALTTGCDDNNDNAVLQNPNAFGITPGTYPIGQYGTGMCPTGTIPIQTQNPQNGQPMQACQPDPNFAGGMNGGFNQGYWGNGLGQYPCQQYYGYPWYYQNQYYCLTPHQPQSNCNTVSWSGFQYCYYSWSTGF